MTTITPPRFWVIYLGCLEKPRSLKEISQEIGYKGLSALYHSYKGKPLSEWMLETKNSGHPFLRLAGKRGREIKYEAVLESLLPEDEMGFWKSKWLKDTVFKFDNIKILFTVKELKEIMIERLGGEFVRLVWAILLSKGFEIYIRENEDEMKKVVNYSVIQRDILNISFANLDVEGYIKAIKLDKHEDELIKLFHTHYDHLPLIPKRKNRKNYASDESWLNG